MAENKCFKPDNIYRTGDIKNTMIYSPVTSFSLLKIIFSVIDDGFIGHSVMSEYNIMCKFQTKKFLFFEIFIKYYFQPVLKGIPLRYDKWPDYNQTKKKLFWCLV